MKIQAKCLLLIPLLSSLALLSGCATPGKNMIPKGGSMTMPEIYKQETGISIQGQDGKTSTHNLKAIRSNIIGPLPAPNYAAFTATSENQVNNLFKQLPNPEVPIYIFPHLVLVDGESYPKPGVTTVFFLYRTNHFAMPDEVY